MIQIHPARKPTYLDGARTHWEIMVDQLPTSTGDRRISEPSTVWPGCLGLTAVGGSCWRLIVLEKDSVTRGFFVSGWWFQIFFMFIPIWGNEPI